MTVSFRNSCSVFYEDLLQIKSTAISLVSMSTVMVQWVMESLDCKWSLEGVNSDGIVTGCFLQVSHVSTRRKPTSQPRTLLDEELHGKVALVGY